MEIIRSVEMVRGKIIILFDSGWKVWLNRKEKPGFPLLEGTAVDRESFIHYIQAHQYPSALEKAVSMLSVRPCSRQEIVSGLERKKYDAAVIDRVIDRLDQENLLNDQEFSEQWAEARRKKYGSVRIYHELRKKGIDEETAKKATGNISQKEQMKNAEYLAARKISLLRSQCSGFRLRRRITDMLIRKGYPREIAEKAYQTAIDKTVEE